MRSLKAGPVVRVIGRRVLFALPLAFGVATLVFVLLEASPVKPCDMIAESILDPAERQRQCAAYGLDAPTGARYASWLGGLVRGDLGHSFVHNRPVAALLAASLRPTFDLALAALMVYLTCGIAMGASAAWKPGSWIDRIVSGFAQTLYGMPLFGLALLLLVLFGQMLGWFPTSSVTSVGSEEWGPLARALDRGRHLVLPACAIGLAAAGGLMRFVRERLVHSEGEPAARAARARGLSPRAVLWRHRLPQALLPVVQLIGLALPALLSGTVVIEVVFSRPGLGRAAKQAFDARDYPVILATTTLTALFVLLGSLLADVLAATLDPRRRAGLTESGAAASVQGADR